MGVMNNILNKMKKKAVRVRRFTLTGIALMTVLVTAAACSAQAAPLTKATWVRTQTSGDTISFPASDIAKSKIVHFSVPFSVGTQNFMAYELGGQYVVRANVCPPCRSVGFSLSGDRLICDTCKTVFNAKTGDGISGACVAYPKAAIPFQNADGKLTMQSAELFKAYQNTLEQGWP